MRLTASNKTVMPRYLRFYSGILWSSTVDAMSSYLPWQETCELDGVLDLGLDVSLASLSTLVFQSVKVAGDRNDMRY